MSGDAPINADRLVADLNSEFTNNDLATLVSGGAAYLSSDDEDATIRAASLALEFAHLAWKNAKAQGRKCSAWQQRLIAIGLVMKCVRARELLAGPGQLRH